MRTLLLERFCSAMELPATVKSFSSLAIGVCSVNRRSRASGSCSGIAAKKERKRE
jgi:hypothetical protein